MLLTELYCVLLWVVILSHFGFAVGQLIFWKRLSGRLTELTPDEAIKTKALWWSIGSYNAAIGVGLLLSTKLVPTEQVMLVQGVTLALIVATAIVDVIGTRSIFIFGARLVPVAVALGLLLCSKGEIFAQAFGVGS